MRRTRPACPGAATPISIDRYLKPAFFAPEGMKISRLLKEMQRRQAQMAVGQAKSEAQKHAEELSRRVAAEQAKQTEQVKTELTAAVSAIVGSPAMLMCAVVGAWSDLALAGEIRRALVSDGRLGLRAKNCSHTA